MGSRYSKIKDKNQNSSKTSGEVKTQEDGTAHVDLSQVTSSPCSSTEHILQVCDSTTTSELLLASSRQTIPMEECGHRVVCAESSCCRICHEGSSVEELISPCYCSGTVGKMHLSCLERWLQNTHRSQCELCSYNFPVERIAKPLRHFLMNPGSNTEFANLVCDVTCFLVLTPLLGITMFLCTRGVKYYDAHGKTGSMFAVVTLILSLVIVYLSWAVLAFLYHYRIWKVWRENTAEIRMSPEKYGRPKRKQAKDPKLTTDAIAPITVPTTTATTTATTEIHMAEKMDSNGLFPRLTYSSMLDSKMLTKESSSTVVNNEICFTNTVEPENSCPNELDKKEVEHVSNEIYVPTNVTSNEKNEDLGTEENGLHKTTKSFKMETTV